MLRESYAKKVQFNIKLQIQLAYLQQNRNTTYEKKKIGVYLITIQASEVTVTKVIWVPMTSLCTDKWPKKTPRYDWPKENRAVHNMGGNKTKPNITRTEVEIKSATVQKEKFRKWGFLDLLTCIRILYFQVWIGNWIHIATIACHTSVINTTTSFVFFWTVAE